MDDCFFRSGPVVTSDEGVDAIEPCLVMGQVWRVPWATSNIPDRLVDVQVWDAARVLFVDRERLGGSSDGSRGVGVCILAYSVLSPSSQCVSHYLALSR